MISMIKMAVTPNAMVIGFRIGLWCANGDKLKRIEILLPYKNNKLDESTMKTVIEDAPYWPWLRERLMA